VNFVPACPVDRYLCLSGEIFKRTYLGEFSGNTTEDLMNTTSQRADNQHHSF
jgi:hypothetical protein